MAIPSLPYSLQGRKTSLKSEKLLMQYLGVDLIEIERIRQVLKIYGEKFLARILTGRELEQLKSRNYSLNWLAGRWAAKEAAYKAVGAGGHRDFEILAENSPKPKLKLYRRAEERARQLGIRQTELSISHSRNYAVAVVLMEAE